MSSKRISPFERKIRNYIKKWERRGYGEGIPDEADIQLEHLVKAPSYRAICLAIMKNDVQCASLGYGRPKTYWYMTLKRIEIEERKK